MQRKWIWEKVELKKCVISYIFTKDIFADKLVKVFDSKSFKVF